MIAPNPATHPASNSSEGPAVVPVHSGSDSVRAPLAMGPTEASAVEAIRALRGPILVLGASGFVGANLFHMMAAERDDVHGTAGRLPAWRLVESPEGKVHEVDLLLEGDLVRLLDAIQPQTIFNCVAYGAYSFERDPRRIYETNFLLTERILRELGSRRVAAYVHAGSSSEYGLNSAGPDESSPVAPNSDYSVSKLGSANLIAFHGRVKGVPCVNLRLYSVYGPLEDSSRLVPAVVRHGLEGSYPPLVGPETSRDFVYVADVCEAFVKAALAMSPELRGASINIGTGRKTTIDELSRVAGEFFRIEAEPVFGAMTARAWDTVDWYANRDFAERSLGWTPRIGLAEGLARTARWFDTLPDKNAYERSSKKYGLDTRHSVSAVIACYRDGPAIPHMYRRLTQTFRELLIDYEIIFVNDCSPDDAEEVIRAISHNDPRVIGISHSRNFGSQAAFVSGMRLSTKNSVVLLDGDMQDPPELIAEFVQRWREGYDVVYGRRVKREATLFMQFAYKAFYRVFDFFSYIRIPHDAGDFSLMDRRVVAAILRFPERDLFLRGVRAFAGFKQTGVDYIRPERMFGRTTNSLLKNFDWAKKGILSFSNTPLNILTFAGGALSALSVFLMFVQIAMKLFYPDSAPQGITTVLLVTMLFGSLTILSIALVGEYLGKVFEEVKRRPLFLRRQLIRHGRFIPCNSGDLEDRGDAVS
jgi:nucleoside-diphosphate-sugar epimerase/glycosyltransferase involved in cell wall biosynthesis